MCTHSLLNLEQVVLMYLGTNVSTCICICVAMNLRESKKVHGRGWKEERGKGNDRIITSKM